MQSLLRCPSCGGDLRAVLNDASFLCDTCPVSYPVVDGRTVMFSRANTLFDSDEYVTKLSRPLRKRSVLGRVIDAVVPGPSVNLARDNGLRYIRRHLDQSGCANVLVVGIGREKAALKSILTEDSSHLLIGVDVDVESDAEIMCDAHELPFKSEKFDAVITTAVLEHVCRPEVAVAEIFRVLKSDGVVYSEIPFLQQVHAGPHDFSRYTRSGHIALFRNFSLLDAGLVAGPGTVLVWSIENFFKLMFQRQRLQQAASILARLSFFWLKYFDIVFGRRPMWLDGASCTYYIGQKGGGNLDDRKLVDMYVGSTYRVTYKASLDL
jgi:SAM-dependent methyltransferase